MVGWRLGTKKGSDNKGQDEGLVSPLLPHGSDDDDNLAAAAAEVPLDYSGPLHHPEVTRATHALSNDQRRRRSSTISARYRRRRSSTMSAAQRRQRRLTNIQNMQQQQQQNAPSGNNVDADASSVSSEITHPISNRFSSYSRMDSEMTDYGPNSTNGDDNNGDDVPREKMTPGMMAKAALVILATTVSIVSYGAAIAGSVILSVSTASTVVLGVAGGVTLLTAPLVWVSEWKLTHMPTLRKRVNDLRQLAIRFEKEIEILKMEAEELQDELEILKQSNDHLEQLVKKENKGNVDDLVELVHENQSILRQMKENIRQVVLQDVVKLVLQSDIDRDGEISKREANILATRLSLSMQVYGIVFDEQKFHRAVGLSPSLYGVMTIVKRLLPDENDRLSSFYSLDSDSDENEDENEDEDEEEEKDDLYDMFYVPVEEHFEKGDADSIQLCKEFMARKGEQPMLMSISPSLGMSVKGLRCSVGYD